MRTPIRFVRPLTGVTSTMGALKLALLALLAASLALAGIELTLFFQTGFSPMWVLVLFVAVGIEYVLASMIAWVRRPANGTGPILFLGGLSLLLAALQNTNVRGLVAVGLIAGVIPIGVILHLLLAFPSGRLDDRLGRWLVIAGYVIVGVLQAPRYLFSDASDAQSVLEVAHRHDLIHLASVIQNSLGVIVIVAAAVVLALRLRRADRSQRRVLAFLYGYGIAAILFLELAVHVLPPLFGFGPITVFVLQISAFAGIPIAFLLGVLRGGFARTTEVEELGAWLAATGAGRPQLRDALVRTLGDDTLELLFWLPDGERYVDATGATAEPPPVGSTRAAVEVELADRRIGAITYDAILISRPDIVRQAGRVIALALDRERLTAELLASRDALRESRARIVDAADRERERIARDLHDGLQASLVLLAMKADRLTARAAALGAEDLARDAQALRSDLGSASDGLRRLVQGVMPALLVERGLYAATEDLVDHIPMPISLTLPRTDGGLSAGVESTGYFVVAEALTNAVKHSRARELAVRLERINGRLEIEVQDDGVGGARIGRGSGLRGLADRLDVLGGRLLVESPPGHGTRVLAEVPCAS
jgi:signal transduction histidine kinase